MTMTKKEALHAAIDGKKVTKKTWHAESYYCFNGECFVGSRGRKIVVEGMPEDGYIIYEEPKQIQKVEVVYFENSFGDIWTVKENSESHAGLINRDSYTEVTINQKPG